MVGNTVVLIGRLVADPELRNTSNGNAVTSFTLAVDKPYNKDNNHPEANFIDCVAWRSTAEFITKYFRKGNKMAVRGSIQTRGYVDKNENKRKAVEVVIEEAGFVEKKEGSNNSQNTKGNTDKEQTTPADIDENDDDLPF